LKDRRQNCPTGTVKNKKNPAKDAAAGPINVPRAALRQPGVPSLAGWRRWAIVGLQIALLAGVTVAAYYPAITSKFIWDDNAYVELNGTLRTARGLWDIWFTPRAIPQYYPLVHTTFWAEYQLFKLNPLPYHLDNVLLHIGSALLLWLVLRRLGLRGGAYAGALLFAAHPVMVESVAWITERKNVLSMFFYLAAILAYLKFDPISGSPAPSLPPSPRRLGFYALAIVLFACSLLSKTVTCTLPAVLFLLAWWKQGKVRWARIWPLLPMLALGAPAAAYTAWLEKTQVAAEGMEWNLSWVGHLLLAGRVPWFYLGKLFWPAEIVFFYPRWRIDPSAWWQYLYPAAAVALAAALWLLRKRIGRGPLTALLCFGASIFPAMGFFNVYPMRYSYVADHFQYHASLAVFALVAGLAAALVARTGKLLQRPPARLRPAPFWREASGGHSEGQFRVLLGAVLTCAVAGVLVALTWQQCHDYYDLKTLWANTARKNPSSWISVNNLGVIFMDEDSNSESLDRRAIPMYERAMTLFSAEHPNSMSEQPTSNLGVAYLREGHNAAIAGDRAKADEKFRRAGEYFHMAMAVLPQDASMPSKFGKWFCDAARPQEALPFLREALALDPNNVDALCTIALVYETYGLRREAVAGYDKAIGLEPGRVDAHCGRARALSADSPDEALKEYRATLAIAPRYAQAMDGIAGLLEREGKAAEAMRMAKQALAINEFLPTSLAVAATVLATHPDANLRDGRAALEYAVRLCRLTNESDPHALDLLACAYAETGDFPHAAAAAQKAIDLAARAGAQGTADVIRAHLRLFQAGAPYRQAGR
jgi:tetratricopeptide (TPR) repeat protein/uncharacterized membrane protein YfcA